jgi:hypothetical protein
MDAQSLYSCRFPGFSLFDSAWLSEADFRRLLPVCCPGLDRRNSASLSRAVAAATAMNLGRVDRLIVQ